MNLQDAFKDFVKHRKAYFNAPESNRLREAVEEDLERQYHAREMLEWAIRGVENSLDGPDNPMRDIEERFELLGELKAFKMALKYFPYERPREPVADWERYLDFVGWEAKS